MHSFWTLSSVCSVALLSLATSTVGSADLQSNATYHPPSLTAAGTFSEALTSQSLGDSTTSALLYSSTIVILETSSISSETRASSRFRDAYTSGLAKVSTQAALPNATTITGHSTTYVVSTANTDYSPATNGSLIHDNTTQISSAEILPLNITAIITQTVVPYNATQVTSANVTSLSALTGPFNSPSVGLIAIYTTNTTVNSGPYAFPNSSAYSYGASATGTGFKNGTNTTAGLCWDQWTSYWAQPNGTISTNKNPLTSTPVTSTTTLIVVQSGANGATSTYTSGVNTLTLTANGWTLLDVETLSADTTTTFIAIPTTTILETWTLTRLAGVPLAPDQEKISTITAAPSPNCILPSQAPQCQSQWDSWISLVLLQAPSVKNRCYTIPATEPSVFQSCLDNLVADPAQSDALSIFAAKLNAKGLPKCTQASMPADICTSLVDGYESGQNMGFVEVSSSTYVAKNIQQLNYPVYTQFSEGYLESNNGSWAWPTSSTLAPGCTVGCGRCTVAGDHVELLYWPHQLSNTTRAPEASLVTAVFNNVTLTSPTLYISYSKLFASDACNAVGGTHYNTIVPVYNQSALSSQFSSPIYGTSAQWSNLWNSFTAPFNVTDLYQTPVPMSIYSSQPWCAQWAMEHGSVYGPRLDGLTAWDCPSTRPYEPILVVPPQWYSFIDPAWASCHADIRGHYDPPIALTPVSVPALPTTPSAPTPTSPAAGSTTPTIVSATAAASGVNVSPTSSLRSTALATKASIASSSSSTGSTSSDAVQNVASAIASVLEISPKAASSSTTATSTSEPPPTFNAISALLATASSAEVQDPTSSNVAPSVSSANAASPSAVSRTATQAGPTTGGVAAAGSLIGGAANQVTQSASAIVSTIVAAGTISASGHSISAASSPPLESIFTGSQTAVGDTAFATAATALTLVASGGSSQVVTTTIVPSTSGTASFINGQIITPSAPVIIISGTTFTVAAAASAALTLVASGDPSRPITTITPSLLGATSVINGQAISFGASVVTISGTTFNLLAPSGSDVPAAASPTTILVPIASAGSLSTKTENVAIIAANGAVLTASQDLGASAAIIGSAVLSVGGPGTTISGKSFSLAPTGLIIDGKSLVTFSTTLIFPAATQSVAVVTAGGQAVTVLQDTGGSTAVFGTAGALTVGGSATTFGGRTYSLASNGLVVDGTSTVAFSTKTLPSSTSEDVLVITTGNGAIVTASQAPGASTVSIGPSIVLSVGGPATTIGGHIFSLASTGLVVDGTVKPWSTTTVAASSQVSELAVVVASTAADGHIQQVGVIVAPDSTATLSVGGPAIYADGEQISLALSGLVVDGQTRSWSTSSGLSTPTLLPTATQARTSGAAAETYSSASGQNAKSSAAKTAVIWDCKAGMFAILSATLTMIPFLLALLAA